MRDFVLSLRVSFRTLAKRPGLSLGVVFCLGLGLGVNVAMFGILDELLWDPPEGVVEPDSVLRVYATRVYPGAGPVLSDTFSYPAFVDLQQADRGSVAAFARTEVVVGEGLQGSKRAAALVSSTYFSTLGVRPILGRVFTEEEARPDAGTSTVVLSHRLWQGRFGGTRSILDEEISIAGRRHHVIGVAPPGFVGVDQRPVDLWLSMAALPVVFGEGLEASRASQIVQVVLRPQGEASPPALAEVLGTRYRSAHEAEAPGGPDAGAELSLWPLLSSRGPYPSSDTRVAVWATVVAIFVLLVSIANVANLLVVRGLGRRRESAVRLVLGAGKTSLVRDVLLEGAILTVGGVMAAVPVAYAVVTLAQRFLLPDLGAARHFVDARVLVFAGLLIVMTTLGCSLLAAIPLRRLDLSPAIKTGHAGYARHRTLRNGLLAGQIALAAVLLVGAGLFLRSLGNVRALDLGLEPERLLVATLVTGGEERTADETERILEAAGRRLGSLPGVEGVAVTATPPFGPSYGIGIAVPGREELPTLPTGGPYLSIVEPAYFEVAGLDLVEGEPFVAGSGEPAAVVNRTFANLVWSEQGALGECVVIGEVDRAPCSRIVGIVEDARRQRLQEPPTLQIYVPLDQGPDWIDDRALVVRASGDPAELTTAVRREVLALSPHVPYVDVEPVEARLSRQYRSWRLGANVFSLFACVAVVLTVAGLYGVTAYSVAQRRRELGVRLALGAESASLELLLIRQGLEPALLGLVLGLAGALLLGRALEAQLFEVSPWDPVTLIAVGMVLILATVGAVWWSARRVRGLQPVEVLTSE